MQRSSGVVGIVLAGGRSSRFGRAKLAEPFAGEPLLWRPIRALGAVCAEVVIVLAPDAPQPPLPTGLDMAIRFARDPEPFGGPLVGFRAGLAAVGAAAGAAGTPLPSIALVVGGDQPALVPAVLVELARRARDNGRGAALEDGSGVRRPLPCSLNVAPALAAAERLLSVGERRPRALLAALDVADIPFADWAELDPEADTLRDVDEPADLVEPAD
jgi:molybdopterin-guanine dinucleotide biosynthesis protein A